jgi:hypothetical protein
MTKASGAPPETGWAKLVPEPLVSDIAASVEFWRDRLGFVIAYQQPLEAFAYLERPEGAQIMLCQRSGKWETAPLDRPRPRPLVSLMRPTVRFAPSRSAPGFDPKQSPCTL